MIAKLRAAVDRIEAGGAGALQQLINEGAMGRGGVSGHHAIIGLESAGLGTTLDEAIADWLADAKAQIAARERGPNLPLWQEGQGK